MNAEIHGKSDRVLQQQAQDLAQASTCMCGVDLQGTSIYTVLCSLWAQYGVSQGRVRRDSRPLAVRSGLKARVFSADVGVMWFARAQGRPQRPARVKLGMGTASAT